MQGAVIAPSAALDSSLSLQPSSLMAPLTQQMSHLSMGTSGTYMTAAAAAPMQGTYIPQYTAVPATAISVEVRPAHSHSGPAADAFIQSDLLQPLLGRDWP
ncbi:RNA-binding motif, single-stranded-interacting protein 3-like [Gadus chalcogrammus]|uniref:RNA-binding motif, single-stranded-interacting protein 3-like n=1 Tax=Gadus chalcogrammus TaxID=1042646 RepID=UPI0024C4B811|nr:RNA-binding motif, single-stranded-interacting protein 3-like [Gadus chalcogrammus]